MPTPKSPPAKADASPSAQVRELAEILNETGLTEIELEREGLRIRVAKTVGPAVVQAYAPSQLAAAPTASATPVAAAETPAAPPAGETITSPMVGTVYLQSQPGAPAFVRVGDQVAAGQTLLLIEAMKTMNPIPAPKAGTVIELLVDDAQPVEFGEPLAVIG
jgi:acetyl-CoA carboxylase biotin carboxyl carrier protein